MTGGYDGHGGGDPGLIIALYKEMMKTDPREMHTSVHVSILSHLIGFAAEESRITGKTIDIEDFYTEICENI